MSDRRLVITEVDSNAPDYGKLLALAPNTASSVPIPAFTFGPTKPPVGSLLGEGFYETNTRRGWVWDGSAWLEIAASPVVSYATDALLLADNSKPNGVFAIAASTGSMYVKVAGGWNYVGIKEYATTAQLLADTPSAGALGIAADDSSLWERTSTGWRCMTIRELADTAAVVAWAGDANCHNGDRAIDLANDVTYIRTGTGWRPTGYWEDTEANIRAATWPLNGQEAISTDSGRTFVRVNGAWVESPINHYPTQAALLAATPSGSQMAWADDTGNIFTWTPAASAWTVLNNGFDDPVPIGAICDFPSRTIPNGWLECDGSAIPADAKFDALRALLGGANLPDLRGLFSRAAKAGEGLLTKVDWTTGKPKTDLTGTTNYAGVHDHGVGTADIVKTSGGNHDLVAGPGGATEGRAAFHPGGSHNHTVTINGGGDAETAPDHARVVRCIKAFHITTVKPAPDQLLTALTAPADGQVLIYDAATSSWKNGAGSYSKAETYDKAFLDTAFNEFGRKPNVLALCDFGTKAMEQGYGVASIADVPGRLVPGYVRVVVSPATTSYIFFCTAHTAGDAMDGFNEATFVQGHWTSNTTLDLVFAQARSPSQTMDPSKFMLMVY